MSGALKLLGQVQLGTGLTTIYAPPAYPPSAQGKILSIWVANSDSSARAVTLRVGSGTLTIANGIMEAKSIGANDIWNSDVLVVVPAGSYLQGLCPTGSVVTVTVFGEEII